MRPSGNGAGAIGAAAAGEAKTILREGFVGDVGELRHPGEAGQSDERSEAHRGVQTPEDLDAFDPGAVRKDAAVDLGHEVVPGLAVRRGIERGVRDVREDDATSSAIHAAKEVDLLGAEGAVAIEEDLDFGLGRGGFHA